MGYWEEVRDVVFKGMNLAMDNLKEGANLAAEKSRQGVAYMQLKTDLFLEQRKLQSLLADLGDLTHDLYKEKKDIYADENVKSKMDEIVEAENKCREIEEKISQVTEAEKKE